MVALNSGFPSGPVVDPATGELTVAGRAFLIALWNRTGAAIGTSSGAVVASIAAETAARQAADVGLTASVSTEGTTRATADSALGARITNEAMIRATADSQLQVQVATANVPSILTEDGVTSLKVSAMPAVNTATLLGTELFTATHGGVNAKWTLNSLYTVVVNRPAYITPNPLNAVAASGANGKDIDLEAGSGDTAGTGGGLFVFAGDGGSNGEGGSAQMGTGNAGGGNNAGGLLQLSSGNGAGAGPGGAIDILGGVGGATGPGARIRIIAGDSGAGIAGSDIFLQPGAGTPNGNIVLPLVPAADPVVSGAAWADGGTIVLSGFTARRPLALLVNGDVPVGIICTPDGTPIYVRQ